MEHGILWETIRENIRVVAQAQLPDKVKNDDSKEKCRREGMEAVCWEKKGLGKVVGGPSILSKLLQAGNSRLHDFEGEGEERPYRRDRGGGRL